MFTFVSLTLICCIVYEVQSNVDFNVFRNRASFLQQFGYLGTSETVPVGINTIPEYATSRAAILDDELGGMNEIPTEVVKNLQKYAGVNQTGVFDEETIGMMMTPRCQNPDILDESNSLTRFFLGKESTRKKRAAGWSPPEWEKLDLTFAFENTTPQNSEAANVIKSAFEAWGECSKLSFTMVDISQSPDIKIKFASRLHEPPENCAFDGPAGVKAHAFYPPIGLAHFDEDEDWSDDCVLYSVALHEIGHVLGLGHSFHKTSIMFAYFNSEFVKGRCEDGTTRPLSSHDIANIRSIYGWQSCDAAEDPQPTVEPTPSEGPGELDRTSPTSEPAPTDAPVSSSMTSISPKHRSTNTRSGSMQVTYATDNPLGWERHCGEIEENILSSPYYPEIYPNGMNCSWTISIPPGMRAVSMHFIRFELEDGGEECVFDYLKITEQDGTVHKLCGSHTQSLTFETKVMHLNFFSDALKQAAGFRILFVYEAEPQKPPCRTVIGDSEGIITNTHPEYDDHEECIYEVNSDDSNRQILIILKDVEEHCSKYELLESEDGEDSLIESCSEVGSGVRHYVSTNGVFFIKFRPQESGDFAIKYYVLSENGSQGCSSRAGTRDYNSEFLRTRSWEPNTNSDFTYYPNTDCILYIPRDDSGKRRNLEIADLRLEHDKSCSYDFVEVYTIENEEPQRYCGHEDETIEISTSGDTLVYFHTDGSVQDTGFSLSMPECMHILRGSDKLTKVQLEKECSYQVDEPKSFACFDFYRPVNTKGGCEGTVEIEDMTTARYCDTFSTLVNNNQIINVNRGGAPIDMRHVTINRQCYQKVRVSSTRAEAYRYSSPKKRECLVHFVAESGKKLRLSFSDVNLKKRCPNEHIKVYQENQGCNDRTTICRKTNGEFFGEEVFVFYKFVGKSYYKVRVSLLSEREAAGIPSSRCPDSCNIEPTTAGATTLPPTTSSPGPEGIDGPEEIDGQRQPETGKLREYSMLCKCLLVPRFTYSDWIANGTAF